MLPIRISNGYVVILFPKSFAQSKWRDLFDEAKGQQVLKQFQQHFDTAADAAADNSHLYNDKVAIWSQNLSAVDEQFKEALECQGLDKVKDTYECAQRLLHLDDGALLLQLSFKLEDLHLRTALTLLDLAHVGHFCELECCAHTQDDNDLVSWRQVIRNLPQKLGKDTIKQLFNEIVHKIKIDYNMLNNTSTLDVSSMLLASRSMGHVDNVIGRYLGPRTMAAMKPDIYRFLHTMVAFAVCGATAINNIPYAGAPMVTDARGKFVIQKGVPRSSVVALTHTLETEGDGHKVELQLNPFFPPLLMDGVRMVETAICVVVHQIEKTTKRTRNRSMSSKGKREMAPVVFQAESAVWYSARVKSESGKSKTKRRRSEGAGTETQPIRRKARERSTKSDPIPSPTKEHELRDNDEPAPTKQQRRTAKSNLATWQRFRDGELLTEARAALVDALDASVQVIRSGKPRKPVHADKSSNSNNRGQALEKSLWRYINETNESIQSSKSFEYWMHQEVLNATNLLLDVNKAAEKDLERLRELKQEILSGVTRSL